MLWATRETHREVELYATDQAKFFANYALAHVRMAHVGCEACGVGTDLTSDPCAGAGGDHHHHHGRADDGAIPRRRDANEQRNAERTTNERTMNERKMNERKMNERKMKYRHHRLDR